MVTKAMPVKGDKIDPVEGLDICIWKLMSDGKRRNATEIGVELANHGCNRTEAKDRAVALMRRGWFKRIEKNQITYYTLKKGIAMPTITSSQPAEKIVPNTKAQNKTWEEVQTLNNATPSPLPPEITGVYHPVVGEGVVTSIWKVMSDRKEYTAREVAELLEVIGINLSTTTYRVNQLAKKGWFIRSKKKVNGRTVAAYILKESVPLPENDQPYATKDVLLDAAQQGKLAGPNIVITDVGRREAECIINQRPEIEPRTGARPGWEPAPAPVAPAAIKLEVDNTTRPTFSNMAASKGSQGVQLDPAYTPDVQDVGSINVHDITHPPLLEYSIKIGGVAMTVQTVKYIVEALIRHGHDKPPAPKFGQIVRASMNIAGVEYNEEELHRLYIELFKAGFVPHDNGKVNIQF